MHRCSLPHLAGPRLALHEDLIPTDRKRVGRVTGVEELSGEQGRVEKRRSRTERVEQVREVSDWNELI